MEDKKITLRMGPSDVQMMDSYLEGHSEFENVSHLIRTAVKKYIQHGDAQNTSSKPTGSGIFVRFTATELDTIRTIMERESFLDEEEFIRTLVRKTYAPMEKGQHADAFITARDVPL